MENCIKLGISSCLLGQKVRYDGGHKRDPFLTDRFGQYVKYVPVCPEVECGLKIPRETLRLLGDPENPRLITTHTNIDHTRRMIIWAKKRVQELEKENLWGFIFKKNSPSCGMKLVKVFNTKGVPEKKGIGIFARVFIERFSQDPIERECCQNKWNLIVKKRSLLEKMNFLFP